MTCDQSRTEEAQHRTSLVTSSMVVSQVIDKTLRDVLLGQFLLQAMRGQLLGGVQLKKGCELAVGVFGFLAIGGKTECSMSTGF